MSTNASPEKIDYLLLFRGTNWDKGLTDEVRMKVVADWYAWFDRLNAEGRCSGGHPLQESGKVVTGKKGRTIADGPFAESKEAVGGYFYLHVTDEAEAIAIAQQCPGLDYGVVVEVRPIADMCSVRVRVQEYLTRTGQLAGATA